MKEELFLTLQRLPLRENVKAEDVKALAERLPARDETAAKACRARWNRVCKPLYALGELEETLVRISGVQALEEPELRPAAVFTFCADNGIVAEGVSQCGQEVTAQVLRNMAAGQSSVSIFASHLGAAFFPIDLGATDYRENGEGVIHKKIMPRGTGNFLREAAMSEQETLQALFFGYDAALSAAGHGVRLLIGGEMGIGNTSTSTAVAAALLGEDAGSLAGRGAGLSSEAFSHKQVVLQEALRFHGSALQDPFEVLRRVGGLDIAALSGMILGAAESRIPVLLDGLITYAAALLAERLVPGSAYALMPTHLPRERASRKIAEHLQLRPTLDLDIALGEGAGSLLLMPLLDLAMAELKEMPSFEEGKVETYDDYLHP